MKKWLKENSLGLVLMVLFFVILLGQSLAGLKQYNQDEIDHGGNPIVYSEYLKEGHFIEATFENWESEFLQMAAYVLLTIHLRQKGSSESKKLDGEMSVDQEPEQSQSKDAPWPVRAGGIVLKVYKHSLSLAFILLFLMSFTLHAYGGAQETCQENIQHGETQCEGTFQYMTTSKFWFESLQNWQSEFLAVFAIVMLSVFLREKGSPESKPVNTPHFMTGTE
jgi:hypothetical protein